MSAPAQEVPQQEQQQQPVVAENNTAPATTTEQPQPQQEAAAAATAPAPAADANNNTAAPTEQQQQSNEASAPVAATTTEQPAAPVAPAAAATAEAAPQQQQQQSSEDASAIKELEAELAKLNEEVSRLSKECDESEAQAQNASLTSGSAKQKVRELSDQVTAATRVRAGLKKENDELTAAVEHGKANTDLNQRCANSKSLIIEYEETLSQKEAEDARSKQLLETMAAQYKRVAERKKTILARVRDELAQLSAAIKVNANPCPLLVRETATSSSSNNETDENASPENEGVEEDPGEQIDILADLAASREADLRDAERHLRESEAIVQLKEEEIVRLQAETAQRLEERRRERDEEIKRMVFGFQDDRKALHDDISEMRRANADQKLKLVRGHVQAVPKANGDATEVFLNSATRPKASPRANTSRRDTHLKPKPKKSYEEVHLEEHNAEIEDSLRAALHALAEEQKLKSEIAKNTKSVQERMRKDDLMFSQKIMQLQAAAASENARARKAEAENEKLCADVSHFSEVLENTRRNIERVRGHSAPLPVE